MNCQQRCGTAETLINCWQECKWYSPPQKADWLFLMTLSLGLQYDSSILFLETEITFPQKTCTKMFIEALLLKTKTWKTTATTKEVFWCWC